MDDVHRVTFARSAGRELERLDPAVARRVLAVIERLATNPRPPSCVKLTGSVNDWRVRVGDWRVIYTIDDESTTVEVAAVRHRREAYR